MSWPTSVTWRAWVSWPISVAWRAWVSWLELQSRIILCVHRISSNNNRPSNNRHLWWKYLRQSPSSTNHLLPLSPSSLVFSFFYPVPFKWKCVFLLYFTVWLLHCNYRFKRIVFFGGEWEVYLFSLGPRMGQVTRSRYRPLLCFVFPTKTQDR